MSLAEKLMHLSLKPMHIPQKLRHVSQKQRQAPQKTEICGMSMITISLAHLFAKQGIVIALFMTK